MKSIRIWRSIKVKFPEFSSSTETDDQENETFFVNDYYTDEELKKISGGGFNAIWTYAILRNIVKTSVFPELGKYSERHLKNLRELIKRAKKYNLKVFLMVQEPRAIPEESDFWKKHEEVRGCRENIRSHGGEMFNVRTLCSSTETVKKYLRELFANMATELPGLGGVMLITASEYPSHCWGNRGYKYDEKGKRSNVFLKSDCPKCKDRNPVDIVNEVISSIHEGIRSVSGDIAIIASNWSWNMYEDDPSPGIIGNLPKDVMVMPEFDRGGTKIILGKKREMDEYSISYSGPAKRFKDTFKLAKSHGIKTLAKLQIGTTHELATVPNLPLTGNLYDKAKYLRDNDILDFEGCWNFGNMITANTSAFNAFMTKKQLKSKSRELSEFAENYFPGCDEKLVGGAWKKFSEAMDSYPYCMPFLYVGPINYALAFPIKPGKPNSIPCGRSWLPDKKRGDSLEDTFGCYSLDEIIKGLGILHKKWKQGVVMLEKALKDSKGKNKKEELSNAWCCYHTFRSAWNIYRAYKIRLKWSESKLPQYIKIAKDELKNLQAALPIVSKDERLGFHGEAFAYMFNEKLIEKKVSGLKRQIKKLS